MKWILVAFLLLYLAPSAAADETSCAEASCTVPPCPSDLAGKVEQDGSIFMSWTLNSYSDVRVYRATNGEAPEPVAYLDFPSTRWLDHDTNPEDTYVYSVAAVGVNQEVDDGPAQGESARCGHLEVGAVPFFPGAIGLVAGLVATAVGAWAMRRS